MARCPKIKKCHTICGIRIIKFIIITLSATLFATAWAIMVEMELAITDYMSFNPMFRAPICLGTASFICLNILGRNRTSKPASGSSEATATAKKKIKICSPMLRSFFVLAGLVLALCSLSCAIFLWVCYFLRTPWLCQWPGYYILAESILIFISNVLMKFGTKEKKKKTVVKSVVDTVVE